ncbi:MAG TPA: hypothetical protein VIO64_11565 [Pseudobacteroides sp.]|uniref:hypothetical protein n=1 Tax=Pseudobacteroides sp. TaxID=1968840 RepID=UPI002F92C92F
MLANSGLFKVLSFDFETIGKNFYTCEVYYKDKSIFILLNIVFPYICFAKSIQYFNIKYFDDEVLENKFNEFYDVIKTNELLKPLNFEDYKQLNKTEIKQLRYYDSLTVGEVIFNFLD